MYVENQLPEPPLTGISGWLVLPAIGIVFSPFTTLRGIGENVDLMPKLPVGSTIYVLNILEMAAIVALAGFAVFVAVRFFGRRRNAPALFIAFLIAQVAFPIVDSVIVGVVLHIPVLSPQAAGQATGTAIGAAIWISYFLRSKRVHNTFTR